MRIVEISVEGLFGTFNHTIPLNQEERITIIHSPNGFGKTAILRLIDGVFNSSYSALRSVPFKSFNIKFDDKNVLTIEKADPKKNGKSDINFSLIRSQKEMESFVLKPMREDEKRFYEFEIFTRKVPYLEQLSPYEWLDTRTNEVLELDDVLMENQEYFPFFDNFEKELRHRNSPDWFQKLKKQINVHFIKTERLQTLSNDYRKSMGENSVSLKPTVSKHSEEVKDSIGKKIGEYASLTQTLERTFPKRLVDGTSSKMTQKKLKDKLQKVEEKRKELISAGLLEEQSIEEPSYFIDRINDSNEIALTLYAEDMTKKLKVFDNLARKIEIFKNIINPRFQYKQMHINKDKGIFFINNEDGSDLYLRSLSSGEQQELVLFYEFLFKVEENSLILIDEPEISLHVAWQMQFLKDLSLVTKNAKFDVLLATHSPQIINDRWDLTVELKGKPKTASI